VIARFIKAMCPEKVCRTCGKSSERIVTADYDGATWPSGGSTNGLSRQSERVDLPYAGQTLGFTDCGHDNFRPGLVLDPFAGSGTTLQVASGHGRDSIGIDLDERNLELARERVGMFLEVYGEGGVSTLIVAGPTTVSTDSVSTVVPERPITSATAPEPKPIANPETT